MVLIMLWCGVTPLRHKGYVLMDHTLNPKEVSLFQFPIEMTVMEPQVLRLELS